MDSDCAIAIQKGLTEDNLSRNDNIAIQASVGIGAGEPVIDGDALFGSNVNLASRICDFGEPGQIIAASVVRNLCIGKDVTFNKLGSKVFKGFSDPTGLELVRWQ